MLAITVAAGALFASVSQAQPAPTGNANPVQRATTLCAQGDEAQHHDDLATARARLDEGLQALGSLESEPARRARLRCTETLAWVLQAQGDRRGAWARLGEAFSVAQRLPANAWQGYEPASFELSRQIWSGAQCAEGLDHGDLEDAEVAALRVLARSNVPAVHQCLGAVRARLRSSGGGVCRVITAVPQGVPAFPNPSEWNTVDAQTGVYRDGGYAIIARTVGGATRYTQCFTRHSEAQMEAVAGQWLVPGAVLAVTARVRPCGEDTDARRCPPETIAFVVDASGTLLGHYAFQRSPQAGRGPLASPFGAIAGLTPFRAEGDVIRVGTRALRVQAGALVSAQ
jgi:hypothetical protein